jgi:hypothetical protein
VAVETTTGVAKEADICDDDESLFKLIPNDYK